VEVKNRTVPSVVRTVLRSYVPYWNSSSS